MKVIFTKDIPPNSKAGQTKNVSDGFARNYLFPNKLAMPFTAEEERKLGQKRKKDEVKKEAQKKGQEDLVEKLNGKLINIETKADKEGTLYAGIGKKEIIEKIQELFKIKLDESTIVLEEAVKKTGKHKIKLVLPSNKDCFMEIEVTKKAK